MGCLGIEPRTNQLKAEYSTIELATLFINIYYNNKYQNKKEILDKEMKSVLNEETRKN